MTIERDDLLMVNDESDKKQIIKYPELFGTNLDATKTSIVYGFEIGPGWKKVVNDGLEKLSKEVKSKGINDFRIVQIKEKFGELRIYTNWSTDELDTILEDLETTCITTCEKCGSDQGKFRGDGWLRVTCDNCEHK